MSKKKQRLTLDRTTVRVLTPIQHDQLVQVAGGKVTSNNTDPWTTRRTTSF